MARLFSSPIHVSWASLFCSCLLTITALSSPSLGLDCSLQTGKTIRQRGEQVTFRQVYNPNDDTVTVQMVYPGQAWLSFGFSTDYYMIGNQAVVGLPDEGIVQFYNLQDESVQGVQPMRSAVSNQLTNASIEQTDSETVLTFTQPMNPTRGNLISVSPTDSNTFIFAVGSSNTLNMHYLQGGSSMKLTACGTSGSATSAPTPASSTAAPTPWGTSGDSNDNGSDEQDGSGSTTSAPLTSPVAAPTSGANLSPTQSIQCQWTDHAVQKQGNNFVVREYFNPVKQTVSIQMIYPGQVWLAMGFAPNGAMVGNTAVVGYLQNQKPVVEYAQLVTQSVNGVVPMSSANQDQLTQHSLVQNGTHTILSFTQPLLPTGGQLQQLSSSATNLFIYAAGYGNTFDLHALAGSSSIQLTPCQVVDQNTPPSTPTAVAPPTKNLTPAPSPANSQTTTAPTAAGVIHAGKQNQDGSFSGSFALEEGLLLQLSTNPTAQTLSVRLTYQGQAYLAFGLSESGRMVGSTAVIGLPDEAVSSTNPGKYYMSDKSTGGVSLLPAEQQTITDSNIEQNSTHTVLTYTRLLQDAGDLSVQSNGLTTFIYAVGLSNSFGNHQIRNSFPLQLTPCGSACSNGVSQVANSGGSGSSSTQGLWKAHGVLMVLAWGFFVPVAVGASRLRNTGSSFAPSGFWFKIHYICVTMALTFTLIGFSLAVHAINKEQGGQAKHFQGEMHQTVGLVVFLAAFVQWMSGRLRPAAPGHQTDKSHDLTRNSNFSDSAPMEDVVLNRDDEMQDEVELQLPRASDAESDTSQQYYDHANKRGNARPLHDPPSDLEDSEEYKYGAQVEYRYEDESRGNAAPPASVAPMKTRKRFCWEIQHRFLGVFLLILSWVACLSGLKLYQERYDQNGLKVFFFILLGGVLGAMLAFWIVHRRNSIRRGLAQEKMVVGTPSSDSTSSSHREVML